MQRREIGSLIIATTGTGCSRGGHAEMELFVTEANEPAVDLYRKLGFRQIDRPTQPPPPF